MRKNLSFLVCATMFVAVTATAQTGSAFKVSKTFKIGGSGGWDYIAIGPGNNRLYVSHGTQVNIIDQSTGDSIGVILNTNGVHGIAFSRGLGKGYTSNGRSNNVSVFDLKSNEVLSQIQTGENPDAIMYDGFSKMIITCNGRSNDLTVIDPATEKVVATIPVGGKPETAVPSGDGKLFVNIEDKNEVVVIDIKTYTVTRRWSLAPAEGPTGLAFDFRTNRLFIGCEKLLVVMDATNGKIVTKIPIGEGCDGVAFDSISKNIFASCGEGELAIIHEDAANKFTAVSHVATKKGARTLAVDEVYHAVYLPVADYGTPAAGEKRAPVIAGTFKVLVVSGQ